MENGYMSAQVMRDYIDKKLMKTDLAAFLSMVWAIDNVQSYRLSNARGTVDLPPQVMTNDPRSPYFAHKWELESLVNRAIEKCLDSTLILPTSWLEKFVYSDFVDLYNAGLKLENAEYGEIRFNIDVFDEMHRLSQRQFEWQRGFSSVAQMYRYAYIFNGKLCRQHILSKFGYSLSDLSLFCFSIKAIAQSAPAVAENVDLQQVFLPSDRRQAIIRRLSVRAVRTRSQGRPEPDFAYSRSAIRACPLVRGRNLVLVYMPLPELVMARSTVNCFFDFYGVDGRIRNEIGERFERYTFELLKALLAKCDLKRGFIYKFKGNKVASPDLLMKYDDRFPDIIFECKSARMSFDAKFSLDPLKSDPYGHEQIAQGVCQIWKYTARRRILKLDAPRSEFGTIGVVLTLDSWLTMSNKRDDIIFIAYKMASKDQYVDRHDNIPVVFCSIEELELVLRVSTEEELLTTIFMAATNKRYSGWLISSIYSHLFGYAREGKEYPFQQHIGEVLPWWKHLEDIRAGSGEF